MLYRVAGFDSGLFFNGPNRSISARAAKGYVHITTINQFQPRVCLDNYYCNCFDLMCRVEKGAWYWYYIPWREHKRSHAHMIIHCVVLCLDIVEEKMLKCQFQAT